MNEVSVDVLNSFVYSRIKAQEVRVGEDMVLPGFPPWTLTCDFRLSQRSAGESWISIASNTQLLIGAQDLSIGQNPPLTGCESPHSTLICGVLDSTLDFRDVDFLGFHGLIELL